MSYSDWLQSHCRAQVGLKLTVLFPQSPMWLELQVHVTIPCLGFDGYIVIKYENFQETDTEIFMIKLAVWLQFTAYSQMMGGNLCL